MHYQIGRQGRIFLCRLEDGEDLLKTLIDLSKKEDISSAFFLVLGAMRNGSIVCGPEKDEIPPKPVYETLKESHEVTGSGTIFLKNNEPMVHFHGAFGKGKSSKVGCLRNYGKTFLLLEVIIVEIDGVHAERQFDPKSGMYLLNV